MDFDCNVLRHNSCTISNLLMRQPVCYFEYWIEIRIPKNDSCFCDYEIVKIQCSKFREELLKLKNDVVDRLYLSRGMTDIDIFKQGKQYIIDYSPIECTHIRYYFKNQILKKSLNAYK